MQLGAMIPQNDIHGSAAALRSFAAAAEEHGYDYLLAADHVLGVNTASRPDWPKERNTSADFFHDPFVMFGFLAGVTKLGFATGVLILAQRQAVLAAKQAASLALLCEGRFRFGVGVGWNPVEFTGLNEDFHNRGRRSEEQVQVMRALWAAPHVTFEGKWHRIEDAGINPQPPGGAIPLWFGGHHENTLKRIAKWGDGWMMLAHPAGPEAQAAFATLRRLTEAEGRDPASLGIEIWTSTGAGTEKEWREEFLFWKRAGVTHVTVASTHGRGGHVRIAGRTLADHIDALRRYQAAVADLL
ncbi:MAG: LLM class F420-dependent oxidoreductase [Rhodospirillales bacterium]|jgi:probable F420-dependent oxidoreductase|nr:LLM class F420-dependent oxidoreductase [Rhodospirillales bacterium]